MIKQCAMVTAVLMTAARCGFGQGVTAQAPPELSPKPVIPQATADKAPEPAKSPRNPDGDKPINPDQPNLKIAALVIVKSQADIQAAGVPATNGVVVRDIPFLNTPEFKRALEPFLGKVMTDNSIRDLQDAIILYCRARGKLLVDVILPEQSIENGVLQLWFLEGKVGTVTVNNPGRKWFKDKLILENTHLQPGQAVDSKQLDKDLNWLNTNPFRQVDVAFKSGGKLELTDVELNVDDRLPWRPYFGYEDSGTRFTGPDRFVTGFNWGNAFGLDQQVNYQYTTDVKLELVAAHSGSYIIPLPWRHDLMLFGSYVSGKADFGSQQTATGISWQTSLRYSIPLEDIKNYRHELSAGFDFKRSNNNLESGGTLVFPESNTEIAQFEAGYSGALADTWGKTSFGLEYYYSPSGLTGDDHDTNYNTLRAGAKSQYMYGRINMERDTRLPFGFTWVLKGVGQIATARLLPSEELALGGYDTVRGYDERVVLGDNGWIIGDEIRTPSLLLGNSTRMPGARDDLQFLAFVDYGEERLIDATANDGANPNVTLLSVGAGLRLTISKNLSLRFDYGYPLRSTGLNENRSRVHIGVLLSF